MGDPEPFLPDVVTLRRDPRVRYRAVLVLSNEPEGERCVTAEMTRADVGLRPRRAVEEAVVVDRRDFGRWLS